MIAQIIRKVKRVYKMSTTDDLIQWLEEEWSNAPAISEAKPKEQGPDIEELAPWNKGRV
jgi:hypothetical protein